MRSGSDMSVSSVPLIHHIVGTGVRHLGDHSPCPQHIAVADIRNRSNSPAGHAGPVKELEPFVARALLDYSLHQRNQDIAVANTVGGARKSLVFRQLCRRCRRAETTPEIVVCNTKIDPAVSGL